MVDFSKLRAAKQQHVVVPPVEIFRRLPIPTELTILYTTKSQKANQNPSREMFDNCAPLQAN